MSDDLLTQYEVEQYTIFGSDDSSDVDVMFYLPELPDLQICRQIATQAESLIISDKEIDVNLCSVKDGLVIDCMKGTIDEVNNMILFTHDLHEQKYATPIIHLHKRNLELKAAPALRGTAQDKINALKNIDLESIVDMGKDKLVIQDFYKLFAFQIGQTIPLIEHDLQLYTKKDIAKLYPMLEPYLYRLLDVFPDIDIWKNYFIDVINCHLDVTKISE